MEDELDVWRDASNAATFWWRDDDAVEPAPSLDRLIGLSLIDATPLVIAVIPELSGAALAERLNLEPTVSVAQHGLRHENHAPKGEKSNEFGENRAVGEMTGDIRRGFDLLRPFRFRMPVFVPPWNRLTSTIAGMLPGLGFAGLSAFGPRPPVDSAGGLVRVNTHVDIVDWRGRRDFVGEAQALGVLTGHLRARREGLADPEEPTGLLTHHLEHDEGCWGFVERLVEVVSAHPASRWLKGKEIFGL